MLVKFDFRNPTNFIEFVRASFDDDVSCNSAGISYSIVDLNNEPVDINLYTIFNNNPPQVRVTAPQGQYEWKIRANSPYATALSDPIEIVVADFCLETAYIVDILEVEIDLTLLGPSVTATFDRPVTDLSIEMDVPNICGPVVYEVTLESGP